MVDLLFKIDVSTSKCGNPNDEEVSLPSARPPCFSCSVSQMIDKLIEEDAGTKEVRHMLADTSNSIGSQNNACHMNLAI